MDFETCYPIFKVIRGQKVTNQIHSCVHDTVSPNFSSNFDEQTLWDYAMTVLDKLIRFLANVSEFPRSLGLNRSDCGTVSRAVIITDKDSDFRFEAAILDI